MEPVSCLVHRVLPRLASPLRVTPLAPSHCISSHHTLSRFASRFILLCLVAHLRDLRDYIASVDDLSFLIFLYIVFDRSARLLWFFSFIARMSVLFSSSFFIFIVFSWNFSLHFFPRLLRHSVGNIHVVQRDSVYSFQAEIIARRCTISGTHEWQCHQIMRIDLFCIHPQLIPTCAAS